MASENQNVTELLQKWSGGDAAALEELTPVIYAELHRIAKSYMRRERDGHTLQTTALVNEAYMRLIDWKTAQMGKPGAFFRRFGAIDAKDSGRFRPQTTENRRRRSRAARFASKKRLPSRPKKTRIWSRSTKR